MLVLKEEYMNTKSLATTVCTENDKAMMRRQS
jgi:hypothetical protein